MRPKSNQPAKLCATANTFKLNDIDERTVEKLKFRPIVNQTDTAPYNATKVIGDYLKQLACNDCLNDVINDCRKLPDMLKMLPPLQKDEEYVSGDFDSLFKNIPLKEKIGYITQKICKTDSCAVDVPLSVILVDLHMIRIGNKVVKATTAPFCKQFIQQKEQASTICVSLDRKIILNNEDIVTTMVYQTKIKDCNLGL